MMLMLLFLSWERECHFPLRCHDLHSQRVAVVNHLTSISSASKTPLIHVASMIDIGSAFLMDGTHQCYHNRRRSYSHTICSNAKENAKSHSNNLVHFDLIIPNFEFEPRQPRT